MAPGDVASSWRTKAGLSDRASHARCCDRSFIRAGNHSPDRNRHNGHLRSVDRVVAGSPARIAIRRPELRISAAACTSSPRATASGTVHGDEVRAPGLRTDLLSAERFIICTSLEIVRWATPRSPRAARHARLATITACSGPLAAFFHR